MDQTFRSDVNELINLINAIFVENREGFDGQINTLIEKAESIKSKYYDGEK